MYVCNAFLQCLKLTDVQGALLDHCQNARWYAMGLTGGARGEVKVCLTCHEYCGTTKCGRVEEQGLYVSGFRYVVND